MTKKILIGKREIGANSPIAIQSMTNTRTKEVDLTVNQINQLVDVGCHVVRVAVLDQQDATSIFDIKKNITIPLVADIHFNHNLAISAIEHGADKIRINPGNITNNNDLDKIIDCAKSHKIPIRIGVNSGSVNKEFLEKYQNKSTALIESLLHQVSYFEKHSFDDLVLSIKSSNTIETIQLNRALSKRTNYPLHIGVTEAGPKAIGITKNCIGIGALLLDGIGDTIRVSLTDDPVEEVIAAKNILLACGKPTNSIEFISCPTCGRCMVDMVPLANEIYQKLRFINSNLKVAVMGCPVNGPGEAKDADIGIAFGLDRAILFKRGEIFDTLTMDNIVDNFVKMVKEVARCY